MRFNITLLVACALLLVSCKTAYYGSYQLSLYSTEYDSKDVLSSNKTYEDDLVQIEWNVDETCFYFNLLNKTDTPIEIDWNRLSYIDVNGYSNAIIHSGVRYLDKNKKMESTIVPPKSKLSDVLLPANNVNYVSSPMSGFWNYTDMGSGWKQSPLIFIPGTYDIEVRNGWKLLLGNIVKVYFPLNINGVVHDYMFSFKLDVLKVNQKRPNKVYFVTETIDFPSK